MIFLHANDFFGIDHYIFLSKDLFFNIKILQQNLTHKSGIQVRLY